MTPIAFKPPAGFCAPHALAGVAENTALAVALSGGADSVALLHMLHNSTAHKLHAVHVHHGIRGEEADRDADFCAQLCATLGVPFTLLRVDVPALVEKTGESLETAARTARYTAIDAFLHESNISLLATAHHADDQLETMLQHLLRGAGLRGLCGIPACRTLGTSTVVRPLLRVSKEDILAYCKQASLPFVTDSTNNEPCCARNRLRLDVIPVLRELWPNAAHCAARCAATLAEDEAYLGSLASDFIKQEGRTPSCTALSALPTPIFARVMQSLLPAPPEATHIEALRALVREAKPHAALSLPGTTVRIENGYLCIEETPPRELIPYEISLQAGIHSFPYGIAVLTHGEATVDQTLARVYPYTARIRFSMAATEGALILRPRGVGERIASGGNHKLVRKLPCMSRYPLAVRKRMPLLFDAQGVVAIPNGPVRDGATAPRDTTLLLYFE